MAGSNEVRRRRAGRRPVLPEEGLFDVPDVPDPFGVDAPAAAQPDEPEQPERETVQLTVTNRGETTVGYDYGDHPFPHEQTLVAGRSGDRMVSADVDKHGVLVSLRVAPEVWQGAHPQRVGRAIVEAVADARWALSRSARARLPGRPT